MKNWFLGKITKRKPNNTVVVFAFPLEIEYEIVQYLPIHDLLRCRRCCKRWKELIDNSVKGNEIWFFQYRDLCIGNIQESSESQLIQILNEEYKRRYKSFNFWREKFRFHWDLKNNLKVIFRDGFYHQDEVWNCEWSPSGRRVATCGRDGRVVLWKLNGTFPKNENEKENQKKIPSGFYLEKSRTFFSNFRAYGDIRFSNSGKWCVASDITNITCLVLQLADEESDDSDDDDNEPEKKKKRTKKDERLIPHQENSEEWKELAEIQESMERNCYGNACFINDDLILDITGYQGSYNAVGKSGIQQVFIVRKIQDLKVKAILSFVIPSGKSKIEFLFFCDDEEGRSVLLFVDCFGEKKIRNTIRNRIHLVKKESFEGIFQKKRNLKVEFDLFTKEITEKCVCVDGDISNYCVSPNGEYICLNVNLLEKHVDEIFEGGFEMIVGAQLSIHVVSMKSFQVLRKMTGPHFGEHFLILKVFCSNRYVTSGCLRTNGFFVWDILTGELLCCQEEHKGPVSAAKFHPKYENLICSVSDDAIARLHFPQKIKINQGII